MHNLTQFSNFMIGDTNENHDVLTIMLDRHKSFKVKVGTRSDNRAQFSNISPDEVMETLLQKFVELEQTAKDQVADNAIPGKDLLDTMCSYDTMIKEWLCVGRFARALEALW
ncbi:uncharacterized protein LOC131002369 [Salvia miltiorrhiza]|uniref:uncharacterized protein LOC131002369 n=1 Tax=Salvia miltiorrhiza TaxID=226208 RepID=UPI0025ABC758|nr:uncharacterized protein LOC131002369 [Salvia miltiorrhiza]XP_057784859.1 uncharacterized protein LOC131002369 [Salvia miltiorrhiza]